MSSSSLHVPAHGAPKTSLRIPGSFDLYLCPPSCARRLSVKSLSNGTRDQAAYLYLTEAELATGAYEDELLQAIDDIMALKSPPPEAMLVHVNCIDDFLGTDMDVLLDSARAAHPGVAFGAVRLNPIANKKRSTPGERIHQQLYEMVRPGQPKEAAVSIVGTFVPVSSESELGPCLAALGVETLRYLFGCETFREYQRLGASCLNIVLAALGGKAAQDMEGRLGIPFCTAWVSYDVEEVDVQWRQLAEATAQSVPGGVTARQKAEARSVLEVARERALAALSDARAAVGERPVVVDSSCSMRPAALALALARAGFTVDALMLTHVKAIDEPDVERLQKEHPSVRVLMRVGPEDLPGLSVGRPLCIGYDSAYLLQASHYVDLRKDEGMFGYYAVEKLARMMAEAAQGLAEEEAR